jgi:hypothetical protein
MVTDVYVRGINFSSFYDLFYWILELSGIFCISFYFNNISVISFTQFYWWEELEFPKKTNNLQVKDKLYTSTVRCIEHTLAQVEIKSPKL